jgi:diguanylate cyclase (GGDEF)-like protein
MADLDNFKVVNDTLGHRAGDDLIITVARLVKARIRATDIVARLGGDEFALLLPRADLREAQWVAESLRASVQAYETVVDGRSLRTTISIGVAEVSAEMTAEDALAAADLAMYEAKHAGRDRVAAAVDADRDPTLAIHHEGWAERLRAALDEDRFCLYRQPIVPLAAPASGSRHELLLRMLDQDGLVPPNAFIYTAERFGLISEIDRWVIANAIRLLAADTDQRAGYHVNVSGLSITTPAFVEFIARELASSGIDPSRLTLEVSETVAIANMETARQFALGLGKAGCQLALDAFGSGFGSFSYLKFLPVQFIKIDAAFITRLDHHEHDRVLVKGIVDVAHGMGIKTIAEHVGTEHTRAMLTDYGADYGQGFHFGQPQLIAPVDAS